MAAANRARKANLGFGRAAVVILVMAVVPRPAAAGDEVLELEVRVNGRPINMIGEFTARDGTLLARRSELHSLGFRVPGRVAAGDPLLPLSRLPGLRWHLDQATQVLYVTTGNANLLPVLLKIEAAPDPGGAVQSGTGASLNYDTTITRAMGRDVTSGEYELRGFSPWGVLSSSTLAFIGGGPGGAGTNSAVRLDTTYTLADPQTLRSYVAGDFITGSLGQMRPVRFGGVQISSNYSLRPDLVTFPLPTVGGSVSVPSTVDVLVNGNRLLSRSVDPGPFEIPELPVVSGAGTVSLAVTNALGRQVVVSLPFYASSDLLAPGLQTYSAQFGAVRRDWGVISNDYRGLGGIGTWRRGLSPAVTVEAGGEATGSTGDGTAGVTVNLFDVAVLDLSGALSTSPGDTPAGTVRRRAGRRSGSQVSAGLQRTGRIYSLSVAATRASGGYRDIASLNGDPVARLQINAGAGLSLGRFGSLGFTYARVDRSIAPEPVQEYLPIGTQDMQQSGPVRFQPAQRAQIVSASYSVAMGPVALYVTGFRDMTRHGSDGVLLGLSIPLGGRSSASASVGTGSSGQFAQGQVSQSPVSIGDWGYQLVGSQNGSPRGYGQVQYKAPWSLLTLGADEGSGQTTLRGETQGAISVVDGGVFASNQINDSFAVVDTNGLAHVRVLQENRDAGRTDAAGRLLVPDLRAFDTNHLAIEPTDVPQDVTIAITQREVRPQYRSGVVVRFAAEVSHGALLTLVDAHGTALPLGSVATLAGTGAIMPVGFDGQAYVEGLKAHNEVSVEDPKGGRCRAVFAYRGIAGEIPKIGPLVCRAG